MVLKLYGVPLSQPFRSVAWACLQKRLPFEVNLVVPGMSSKMGSKGPAYLKLNPTGTVPTLEDDGVVVLESAAMLSYLANKHQWTDLYPQEAAARARSHTRLEPRTSCAGFARDPTAHTGLEPRTSRLPARPQGTHAPQRSSAYGQLCYAPFDPHLGQALTPSCIGTTMAPG